MWNALLRALQQFDAEGRARFAALTTDTERLINTKATATKFTLIAWAALILPTFFAMAVVILHFNPGGSFPGTFWLYLFWWCIWLSWTEGSALGYILGWSVGLYWQGKRLKAGYVSAGGGAVCLALMALFEALYFEFSGLSPLEFAFWAFVTFSPVYLTGAGMVAWGLNLLSSE